MVTLGLFVGFFLLILLVIKFMQFNLRRKVKAEMMTRDDFSPAHYLVGKDGTTGLAIDTDKKLVCLVEVQKSSQRRAVRLVPYRDILALELLQNGVTVTGSAGLGAAAGPAGVFLGRSTSKQRISRIDLKVTINDLTKPAFIINFFNTVPLLEKGQNANGIVISQVMTKAHEWMSRLDVAIKQGGLEGNGAAERGERTPAHFVADELTKLVSLRDDGVLTQDEFARQKSQLLAGSQAVIQG